MRNLTDCCQWTGRVFRWGDFISWFEVNETFLTEPRKLRCHRLYSLWTACSRNVGPLVKRLVHICVYICTYFLCNCVYQFCKMPRCIHSRTQGAFFAFNLHVNDLLLTMLRLYFNACNPFLDTAKSLCVGTSNCRRRGSLTPFIAPSEYYQKCRHQQNAAHFRCRLNKTYI